MGIFKRITSIISSKTNSSLESNGGYDSNRLIEKQIKESKEAILEIKSKVSVVEAEEVSLKREIMSNNENIEKYRRYTKDAINEGRESEARRFLSYALEAEKANKDIEIKYSNTKKNSENMKTMLDKLTKEVMELESRLVELNCKLNLARESSTSNSTGVMVNNLQKEIDIIEAKIEIEDFLSGGDRELDELKPREDYSSLDEELEKLKRDL